MIIQLPKNTNMCNLLKIINLCSLPPIVRIEKALVEGRISQLFVFIGDISFTAIDPDIYKIMLCESKQTINNLKQMKKELKTKLKQ